jgi:hypothetical protein
VHAPETQSQLKATEQPLLNWFPHAYVYEVMVMSPDTMDSFLE